MGSDPVKAGVVASLNRPEGNVTGVSFLINSLGTKRVELISQLVPRASTIGMLANPNNPDAEIETRDAQAAAQALGRKLLIVKSSPGSDLGVAFATLVEQGVGALAVSGDPFFEAHRDQLIALAARHMMPAIYVLREDPAAGGLMSYGTSIRCFSPGRRLRRLNPQGHQAVRSSGDSVHQIRVSDQPQDRQDAQPRRAADVARRRRRGDRIRERDFR